MRGNGVNASVMPEMRILGDWYLRLCMHMTRYPISIQPKPEARRRYSHAAPVTVAKMIKEIDDNRYGNASIASGSFGEVSIALYRPVVSGTTSCTDDEDETRASWGYAAVKTIRNAVLASSVEGMSLASSWGFAGADHHHEASGDTANSAAAAGNSSKPPQLSREAFAELAALRSLASGTHPCIVPLIAAYPSQSGLCRGMGLSLVFPYCPSDLSSAIQRRRYNAREGDALGGMIPDCVVKAIVRDMMLALKHCHEHGVVHGDVNPANFMISTMGRIQLGDFGLATACPSLLRHDDDMGRSERKDGEKLPTHALCAINYRAPEIFLGETFAHPSQDIWGAGLILCELLTLRTAFPGRNDIDQLNRIFDVLGTPSEKIWPSASSLPDFGKICFDPRETKGIEAIVPRVGICQDLQEVANAMVSLDPRTRSSASECLQMSWLAAVSAQSLPAADTCQVLEAMVPSDLMVSPVIFSGDLENAKRDAVAIAKKRRDHSRSTCQIQRHQNKPSRSAGKFACRMRGNGLLPALFISSILLNSCYLGEAFQVGSRCVRRPLYQPKAHVSPATSGKCKSPWASNHISQTSTAIHARGPVGYDDEYFRQKRISIRGRGRGMFSNLSVQKILVLLNIVRQLRVCCALCIDCLFS